MAGFKCQEFRPCIGTTEARICALERAVTALTQELRYVLSHLDGDNITPEVLEQFRSDIDRRIKEAVDHGAST